VPSGIDDVRYSREFRCHYRGGTPPLPVDLANRHENRDYVRIAFPRSTERLFTDDHRIVILSSHNVKIRGIILFIKKDNS
jgi:hypothetical protein